MSRGLAESLGSPERHRQAIEPVVTDRIQAVLDCEALASVLYGSYARGTAIDSSDIDVLQLVTKNPGVVTTGNISVTRYTYSALSEMARRGSLFVLHLRVDSYIISDRKGHFAKALAEYRQPISYEPLFVELRASAIALRPAPDTARYKRSLHKLGTYLLRTAIYARLAERSTPIFDVVAACQALGDDRALLALRQRRDANPDEKLLELILNSLASLVGPIPQNDIGSVEGLAVDMGGTDSLRGQLLSNLVSPNASDINYAILVPPLL